MCLGTNIRGGRQFNMLMSEHICTMVDLFDKAVALTSYQLLSDDMLLKIRCSLKSDFLMYNAPLNRIWAKT